MNLLEGWLYYCILLYPVFFSIPNGQTSPSRERIYSAVNWGRFTERGRFPNIGDIVADRRIQLCTVDIRRPTKNI